MFKRITGELNGIRLEISALTKALRSASDGLRDLPQGGADAERLNELEGRMEVVLGQVEAGLIKGEALKATARAAEDRARGHMKRAEGYAELASSIEGSEEEDTFEAFGRAYGSELPEGNDGPEQGVPPMPNGVAHRASGLAAARAAKRR